MKYMEIPVQFKGGHTSARKCFKCIDGTETDRLFAICRYNLLDVNSWNLLLKLKAGTFTVTDPRGNVISGPLREGYLIKIKLAGPGIEKDRDTTGW